MSILRFLPFVFVFSRQLRFGMAIWDSFGVGLGPGDWLEFLISRL